MAIGKQSLNTPNLTRSKPISSPIGRLPRRFSQRFKSERAAFLQSIQGFSYEEDRARYASLLLIRLMFIYFLQKKGLLDNDLNYLRNQLRTIQQSSQGNDSFYRHFLLCCFHEASREHERSPGLNASLDNVPHLLSNLFNTHELACRETAITIPDEAFERLFAFFDTLQWNIDERPTHNKKEIHPAMLGYIFEKFIDQKQMGAYYTHEDVSEYIAKTTIIPFLLTATEKKCAEAFQQGAFVWEMLRHDPDRYIYPALKKGIEYSLPQHKAAGLDDVSRRSAWNQQATETFALSGENWHEVIARRRCYEQIHSILESGNVHSINDLVTYNLDIRQFVQDMIERCEQPELLVALYENLVQITVLDPTCGSGVFLFAALDILEPLYDACIGRMQAILSSHEFHNELEQLDKHVISEPQLSIFRIILKQIALCPNRRYFILKSIITNNLYGVDIMEEATEICKLRLLLKLIALVERVEDMESFAAIDLNIHAGNILLAPDDEAGTRALSESNGKQFHRQSGFYNILQSNGFDVVIGNPPYVEYEKVSTIYKLNGYNTLSTGNLYALTVERCHSLLAADGRFGMIVPSSATCTDGYLPLQKIFLEQSALHISSYSDQRGKLFDIPHPRLCIITYQKRSHPKSVFSTPYLKLGRELRYSLFQRLKYIEVTDLVRPGIIPRYGSPIERTLHAKVHSQPNCLGDYVAKTGSNTIYYTRKMSWFVQVTPFIPAIVDEQGKTRNPSELKALRFLSSEHANIAFVALNSNLFYWFVTTGSDCRNLNMREVLGLPLNLDAIAEPLRRNLRKLAADLAEDLHLHSEYRKMHFKGVGNLTIQCLFPGKSKAIIDEIDRVLAQHYGFTDEELDFILDYDAKYRTGQL
jgi:type I restriction-modification system DNA methylase subunit